MKLVHSTYELENVRKILREGLKPSKDSGKSEYDITQNSDVICFSARDEKEAEHYMPTVWGIYHFVLNDKWFMENIGQFREHSEDTEKDTEKEFWDFVKRAGLQPYEQLSEREKLIGRAYNQILSIQPVPVEGIEELVIPSSEIRFINSGIPKNMKLRLTRPNEIV